MLLDELRALVGTPEAEDDALPMPFADFAALVKARTPAGGVLSAALDVEDDSASVRKLAPAGVELPTVGELLDAFSDPAELAYAAEWGADTRAGDENGPEYFAAPGEARSLLLAAADLLPEGAEDVAAAE